LGRNPNPVFFAVQEQREPQTFFSGDSSAPKSASLAETDDAAAITLGA